MLAKECKFAVDLCREALSRESKLASVVVFGSAAKDGMAQRSLGVQMVHDIDLHIIARDRSWPRCVDWRNLIEGAQFVVSSCRPTVSGIDKWTICYSDLSLDVVVVPMAKAKLASIVVALGLHVRMAGVRKALNEMATCLHGGFFFIKGQIEWGGFYRAVSELPGVRLSNEDIVERANRALCDYMWIMEKAVNGELLAASHAVHCRLLQTNLELWREMRLRRGLPLAAFGLGRKVEFLEDKTGLGAVTVSSLDSCSEVKLAAGSLLNGLVELVSLNGVAWSLPEFYDAHTR